MFTEQISKLPQDEKIKWNGTLTQHWGALVAEKDADLFITYLDDSLVLRGKGWYLSYENLRYFAKVDIFDCTPAQLIKAINEWPKIVRVK